MLEDRNCWLHVLMRLPLSWKYIYIYIYFKNFKYFNTHTYGERGGKDWFMGLRESFNISKLDKRNKCYWLKDKL